MFLQKKGRMGHNLPKIFFPFLLFFLICFFPFFYSHFLLSIHPSILPFFLSSFFFSVGPWLGVTVRNLLSHSDEVTTEKLWSDWSFESQLLNGCLLCVQASLPGVLPGAPGVRLPHRGHLPGVRPWPPPGATAYDVHQVYHQRAMPVGG